MIRARWILTLCTAAPAFAATCDSLNSLKLPDTTITSSQLVPMGSFVQPGGGAGKGKATGFAQVRLGAESL